jgi:hypothetical protein
MWINLWLVGRFAFVNMPLVESAVVETSVSSYGLRYHDVRLSTTCMLRGLGRAIRTRRAGTVWFAVFVAQRVVKLHSRWLLGRLRRKRRLTS